MVLMFLGRGVYFALDEPILPDSYLHAGGLRAGEAGSKSSHPFYK